MALALNSGPWDARAAQDVEALAGLEPGGVDHVAGEVRCGAWGLFRVIWRGSRIGSLVWGPTTDAAGDLELNIHYAACEPAEVPILPLMVGAFEVYARKIGAKRVRFLTDRDGLERAAVRRLGYRLRGILDKELDG